MTCKPKKNILFLKTHKTASASIKNIFLRYGDNHNLTFVLPQIANYFGHPELFNRRMLYPQGSTLNLTHSINSKSYNIFTHHARFNYNEMKSIMPTDTIFVTILRDPVFLMESLFSYFHLEKFYEEKSSTRAMERFFTISSNISIYHASSSKRFHKRFGRNQMSFDLGLQVEDFDRVAIYERFIKRLGSQFHLIMIAERMEESLILLKHLLCWSLDDVIVFQHNMRNVNSSCNLSTDMKRKIRYFNKADQMLYDYFCAEFDRKVYNFGKERVKTEIFRLRNATQSMYNICVEKKTPMNDIVSNRMWYSDMTLGLKQKPFTDKICSDLTMYGQVYTDFLREKQRKNI